MEPLDDNSSSSTEANTLINGVQGGPIRRTQNRLSRFVFTLNNWTQPEYDWIVNEWSPRVKWMIVAKETGESGTLHLQGACIIGTQTAFSTLKTSIGFRRAHIEQMRGKPADSLVYCTKQDMNAFVCGTLPAEGKRSDLLDAVSLIRSGSAVVDLATASDESALVVTKFYKGLIHLRSILREPRSGPPKVIWLFGPTGVGKTRCAFESGSKLAPDSRIWISSGGLRWFDGFDGHDVAIFDDFRAKHVPNFAFLLRLLDRYPMQVEFKGGFVEWTPKYIFITCPTDPDECFARRKEHVPEDIKQLHRRITKVINLPALLGDSGRGLLVDTIVGLCTQLDG